MELELKNIKVHPDMSEETTCFSATLWVDGKPAASCRNDGRGAPTDVLFWDGNRSDIAVKAYEYCRNNPVILWAGDRSFILHNVEDRVDELLMEYLQKRMIKRDQNKGLILHKKDSKDPYYVVHATWKFGSLISTLMKTEQGRNHIKNTIIESQKDGYEILNTNIDFKEIGL